MLEFCDVILIFVCMHQCVTYNCVCVYTRRHRHTCASSVTVCVCICVHIKRNSVCECACVKCNSVCMCVCFMFTKLLSNTNKQPRLGIRNPVPGSHRVELFLLQVAPVVPCRDPRHPSSLLDSPEVTHTPH